MYQSTNLEPNTRGKNVSVKKNLTSYSLGKSSKEYRDPGSVASFNGFHSQSDLSWESNANQYLREPEFIETDFTSPLTEIDKPLSLNVSENVSIKGADSIKTSNKRPYSDNQIAEDAIVSKSLIFSNGAINFSSACQENEKTESSQNKNTFKTLNSSDRNVNITPMLVKTSASGNFSSIKTSFSQKSSLVHTNNSVAQNYNKVINLKPKMPQFKKIQPNILRYPAISISTSSIKIIPPSGIESYRLTPNVPKNAYNLNNSRMSPYSRKFNTSDEGLPCNNSIQGSPLNLSSKSGPDEDGSKISSVKCLLNYSENETLPKNSEISVPLNLILKKKHKELHISTDSSLQTSLPMKLEPSSLSSPSIYKSIKQSHHSKIFKSLRGPRDSHSTSKLSESPKGKVCPMPLFKSALLPASNEESLNNPCPKDGNDSQTLVVSPLKMSKVSSNLNSLDIKEEIASCTSTLDNEDEYQQLESDDGKFIWEDYLEHCATTSAPSVLFKHVECSLQNGLQKGMLVEVANRDPIGTFWVASIIMSCGQLLMLRPVCCQANTSLDYWCDMSTCELHPLGWCATNQRLICPPKDLTDKVLLNWDSTLKESLMNAITPPPYMLNIQKTGSLPFDRISTEMIYEVQEELDPDKLWYARVVENVGGRLLLQYEGGLDEFWIFYTSHKLHPIGFSYEHNKQLMPPIEIMKGKSENEWKELSAKSSAENNGPPAEVFKDQDNLEKHNFHEDLRLELLDATSSAFKVAHVSKIINDFYFIVEPDGTFPSDESPTKFCCHQNSSIIFPVGWHQDHGLKLLPVPGYNDGLEFDWSAYLEHFSFEMAPSEYFSQAHMILSDFEKGMKLEAVDSRRPDEICAATIEDIKGPLFWIKLDDDPSFVMIIPHDSHEIFPIGWCESNNYQLKVPLYKSQNGISATLPEDVINKDTSIPQPNTVPLRKSSGWCPKIYFNTKCYSGPFLSKWRLHNLPKSIGPGSVVSVMTTVLTKLISSAYKSSRVLRELQIEGLPNPSMHQHILKTKYNAKNYSANVEICTSASQVDQFCRDICRRLICCPNLISTHSYPSICPESCLKIAKSKHYFHFGERRKQIGRPRGGHSNIEQFVSDEFNLGQKRRKRHKKKLLLTLRKKHGSNSAPTHSASDAEASSQEIEVNSMPVDVNNEVKKAEALENGNDNNIRRDDGESIRPCESVTKLKIVCNQEKEDGNKSYVICNNSNNDNKSYVICNNSNNDNKSYVICNNSNNDNKSYVICNNSNDSGNSITKIDLKKRKLDEKEDGNCKKPQEVVHKRYEVKTRGISLTKNYSFEKKSHKKIFIIPPTPPVIHTPSLPQLEKEPSSKSKKILINSSQILPENSLSPLKLISNPAEWSVQQVTDFIKMTDCSKLSKTIRDQEIDGKSLLLLTLPTVQEFIEPKLGPAVKLCDLVERLKHAFFSQYANTITI